MLTVSQSVQLDPDVGEKRRRTLQGCQVGVLGQERCVGREGSQHAEVAQAAVALLEIGLEQERDVAGLGAALGHLLLEQWEVPGAQAVAPGGSGFFEQRLGHSGFAPHHPAVKQSECHPHVLGRNAEHLGGATNGVVEVHTLVPDRVPDGVGNLPDLPVAVVDQHHIEVAVGAQGGSAVTADCHEGQVPRGVARGPFGQAGEPGIGLGGVTPAEFLALQPGLGQQAAAPVT